jgi:tetratricopeptide (TPR) repeat protein
MRVCTTALVIVLAVGFARADEREDAGKLLDEGVALFNAKKYREALEKFDKAYATFASPKILFNVAGALEQLGREAEAAQTYDRFLTQTDANDAQAQDRIKAARQALGALDRRLSRLRLQPPPSGAFTLDGLTVNASPGRPIYVAPGRHVIEETIDGTTRTVTTDVAAGEERTIELRTGQAKQVVPAGVTIKTVQSRRLWTYVVAGIGGGLLVGAAVEGTNANAAFQRYQSARTLETWEQERSATKDHALIANVCFAGAGVAIAAAVVLFFVEGGERQVIVAPTANGASAMLQGRF